MPVANFRQVGAIDPFDPFDFAQGKTFAANELEASSVHLPPQRSPKLLGVLGQALP